MNARVVAAALVALFALLVAFGVTGSSFDIALNHSPGLVSGNSERIAGSTRPIRSDEWAVLTPMAIGQANHSPAFPIVNQNLGEDGHNMLVIGMVGVPVAHISALAKPATWGFFLFDLERGLDWLWWFPIFACLLAVWGVMQILLPDRWKLGLAVAVAFSTSAYMAAWSNWPAYAVFFPAAAFCLAHKLFIQRAAWVGVILSLALGVCLAGFVLVLYPPWQISVGYLFLFLFAGVAWRDGLLGRLTLWRSAGLVLALAVALGIVYFWWIDAKSAVSAMQATLYPGERVAASGGEVPLWEFVEGFLNHYTLYFNGATGTNPSESSSFIYFFPVALLAIAARYAQERRLSAVELSLGLFCIGVAWFQLLGVPPLVARWSLWGRVPDYRADLSLGLASFILCALVVSGATRSFAPSVKAAWVVSGAWALAVTAALMQTPVTAVGDLPASVALLAFPIVFVLSYWLWTRNATAFFAGTLFLTCSTSLPFSPLMRATDRLDVAAPSIKAAAANGERVLVLGGEIQAMTLMAAGVPVENGVFYYPPQSLWKRLDPDGRAVDKTNRFQHLIFLPADEEMTDAYRIDSPQKDVVNVRFNPQRFDFSLTQADVIVALPGIDLSGNPSVSALENAAVFKLYKVKRGG